MSLQKNQVHRSLIIFKQFWIKCCVLVLTVFRSLGSAVSKFNTGRDAQDTTGKRPTIPLLSACPSLTVSPSVAWALRCVQFFHEEITLVIRMFLFLSNWINAGEPADDGEGVALQNDKTGYEHTHKTAGLPPLPGVHRDESRLRGLYPSPWWMRHFLLCS